MLNPRVYEYSRGRLLASTAGSLLLALGGLGAYAGGHPWIGLSAAGFFGFCAVAYFWALLDPRREKAQDPKAADTNFGGKRITK